MTSFPSGSQSPNSSNPGNESPTIKIEDGDIITQLVDIYVCAECTSAHPTARVLATHFSNTHNSRLINPRLIPCSSLQCNEAFTNQSTAEVHYNAFHQGNHPCPYEDCPIHCKSLETLNKHLQNHPARGPGSYYIYSCPISSCSHSFRTASGFRRHLSSHDFTCHCRFRGCDQYFTSIEEREQHLVNLHSISFQKARYSCPQAGCILLFSSLDGLYQYFINAKHNLFKRTRGARNPFTCVFHFCSCMFPNEDEIKIHHTIVHKPQNASFAQENIRNSREAYSA